MIDTRPVTCQDCGWKGTVAQCEPIAPRHLPERVAAGDIMPAGECPECGASAMLDADAPQPCVRIVTRAEPGTRTHFGVRSTTQSARRRHGDGLGHVRLSRAGPGPPRLPGSRVYRRNPYPPMLADGYLRIETA